MLRHAREAQGLSLADMATELCVMQRYLHAIEDNEVEALPGSFFFVSFARQYAALLRLDPVEVNVALAAIAEPPERVVAPAPAAASIRFPRFRFPSFSSSPHEFSPLRSLDPIVEDTNRRYFAGPTGLSWVGLVAAVLVGSGVFAWWTRPPQIVRPQSVRVMPAAPSKIIPTASPTVSTPENQAVESQTPAISGAPIADGLSLQTAAVADDGKQVTLNLSATERTWLSITSHGKVIFSGFLNRANRRRYKARKWRR